MLFYHVNGQRSTIANADEYNVLPQTLEKKLVRIVRFQGQPGALSVADHMRLCWSLAPTYEIRRAMLTHDLAEVYTGDMHGLYKTESFRQFEERVEDALRARGWFIAHNTPDMKRIDLYALELEKRHIWGEQPISLDDVPSWSDLIYTHRCYQP